jgi:peptidyl-prolyl cis-trans isomerase D
MEGFRNLVKGWLGKVLLAVLIVPFAIVGVESYFSGGGRVVVAEVNGEKIHQPELDQQVERQRQQMMAQMAEKGGNPADIDVVKLRKQVLDGMINRLLLTQSSKKSGYLVSDATVIKLIREVPAFQEDGKFSQSRYEQMLRQIGEDPASYPAKAKQEMAYSMMIAGLGQSAFVTRAELDRLASLEAQRRDIHFAVVPAARFLSEVAVTDADIKKFYDANGKRFTTAEMVAIEYITLKRDDFISKVTVSEDDLKARYEEKVKDAAANEQRQSQHILISVDDKTKDAVALKKIQEIEKRARAGEDFGKLAKEFSQDTGSVANGGDLGFAGRGQFDPAFEKSLFSLAQGDVSAPVRSQYGYHLIKLNKIQAEAAPSFASLRAQLEQEARLTKAEELYAEQVEKLDAAVYESSDLKEPSTAFGLAVSSTGLFAQTGGEGMAAQRKIVDTAFSDDLLKDGKNSQAISLDDGSSVWLRVREHQPAKLRALAEVAPMIRNELVITRAGEKSKAVAEEAGKALAAGSTLDAVAAKYQLVWTNLPNADRRVQVPSVEILRTAFRLSRPAAGKVSADTVQLGMGYGIAAVSKVIDGPVEANPMLNQMRTMLAENRSQQEFQDYVRFLREEGDVETHLKDVVAEEK